MAENHVSTRPPIARKPHRYRVDEGLDVRFLRHANSAHVSQTLWRGLDGLLPKGPLLSSHCLRLLLTIFFNLFNKSEHTVAQRCLA